jgi:hypothetical protein
MSTATPRLKLFVELYQTIRKGSIGDSVALKFNQLRSDGSYPIGREYVAVPELY